MYEVKKEKYLFCPVGPTGNCLFTDWVFGDEKKIKGRKVYLSLITFFIESLICMLKFFYNIYIGGI